MTSMAQQSTWRAFTNTAPWAWQGRSSRRRRQPAPPLAAAEQQPPAQRSSQPADPSSSSYEFTYRGSDGRVKATFEQAFKNRVGVSDGSDGSSSSSSQERAPWALSYQMSERYSLLWNDDLKARLLKVRGSGQ